MRLSVSIPGKVMIAGEYVALRGASVLASAVGPGMTLEFDSYPESAKWVVESEIWSHPREVDVLESQPNSLVDPLLACVWDAARRSDVIGGKLSVRSCLRIQDGLGTSSALRLGVALGFSRMNSKIGDPMRLAWEWQKQAQNKASGYDVVTQFHGGTVLMQGLSEQEWPGDVQKLEMRNLSDNGLQLYGGGEGAPTQQVMSSTLDWLSDEPDRWERLRTNSILFQNAFLKQHPDQYELCGKLRDSLEGCPYFPKKLAHELKRIDGVDKSWSFKFTGAGGEDAILLLGDAKQLELVGDLINSLGWNRIDKKLGYQGARIIEESF